MVGNDIIDLKAASSSSQWERRGFIQKIFTIQEQDIITSSADPFASVWHLWSMKESAYKVFIQAGGEPFFSPTRIKCSLDCSKNGQVTIDTTTLKTSTSVNSNYIFCTATSSKSDIATCIFQLPENNIQQHSNFIHHQVVKDFAKINSLNCAELEIKKTTTGVPLLHYKNRPLNTSISLTHHGKYGAYSILNNPKS